MWQRLGKSRGGGVGVSRTQSGPGVWCTLASCPRFPWESRAPSLPCACRGPAPTCPHPLGIEPKTQVPSSVNFGSVICPAGWGAARRAGRQAKVARQDGIMDHVHYAPTALSMRSQSNVFAHHHKRCVARRACVARLHGWVGRPGVGRQPCASLSRDPPRPQGVPHQRGCLRAARGGRPRRERDGACDSAPCMRMSVFVGGFFCVKEPCAWEGVLAQESGLCFRDI